MAAKQTPLPGNVIVETVGSSLNINRTPVAGNPPTVAFNVGLTYVENTYLTDEQGVKVKLLMQNENAKYVGYTPDQAMAFYLTPMKKMDGTVTCFGEFLADLWDAAIQADLMKVVP